VKTPAANPSPYVRRALSANEIRAIRRYPWDCRELALFKVEDMHARLNGALASRDYDAADRWRAQVQAANDACAVFDREMNPPPIHTCAPPSMIDNIAAHDLLERERSFAHAALATARGLTEAEAADLRAREDAAVAALRELRIVRQVRMHGVWSVTIWIVDPRAPSGCGYDATAVHDHATDGGPCDAAARFDLRGAERWAAELCRWRA
jgi:hypothetical protein